MQALEGKSAVQYIDHLFVREYYRWWCMRAGNKMFSPYGINDREERNWKTDLDLVHKWKSGKTGMPLVDAMMRELNSTGYLSNRGRQVVASYLTFDLQ